MHEFLISDQPEQIAGRLGLSIANTLAYAFCMQATACACGLSLQVFSQQ